MTCNNQQNLIQDFKNRVREFTTPLVALQQLLNLIQNSPEDNIRNWIPPIKTNNRRLLESMNNVLFCSQYDEETESSPPIPMTSINLEQLIEDIYSELLPDAKSKNLNLVLNIQTREEKWILGNPEYLKRGIRNLIDNAIKFTQFGTVTITFSVSPNGKRIITISDTGCGIKREMQNTIFDRYRPHLSSGLGLYVARAIAQQHGGSVLLLESNSKGSTFEFSLPFSLPSSKL
jgi:two-component system, sensor histidine kinase and response regulator